MTALIGPLTVFVAVRPKVLNQVLEQIEHSGRLRAVGAAGSGTEAIAYLEKESVDVALIDFALPGISGVKVAEFLVARRPDIISVLLSDQGSSEYYRRAMLAGAREFITWPVSCSELEFCLERVAQITREQARRHGRRHSLRAGGPKGLDSRWVVLASGKGGVGASFLAANVASVMAEHPLGFRTALIDFNLTSADLAGVLNVQPARYLTDLVPAATELDRELLKSAACRIDQNLDLFPGPSDIDADGVFSVEQVRSFIESSRELYDVLIVDLGTFLGAAATPVLSAADIILPVTIADVLSIRATARFVRLLERLGINQNIVRPVVNRWTPGELSADRISGHIGASVIAILQDSPAVRPLLDEGRLLTAADDSDLRAAIESLARNILVSAGLTEGLHV